MAVVTLPRVAQVAPVGLAEVVREWGQAMERRAPLTRVAVAAVVLAAARQVVVLVVPVFASLGWWSKWHIMR